MIKSPYNFVPLSEHVILPDGPIASPVSHDVPFSDGISAELPLRITTKSPIYIRAGGTWNEEDKANRNSPMQSFFEVPIGPNGQSRCVIPGSSIKGVIRNVLEIASFGRMCRIDNKKYSTRKINALSINEILKHSSKDHLQNQDSSFVPDISDLVFGYTHKHSALRGRAQFSHMVESASSRESRKHVRLETIKTVLGEPKPTFFPYYVRQTSIDPKDPTRLNVGSCYKTFENCDADIRGWKRYPVDDDSVQPDDLPVPAGRTGKMDVYFRPLPVGTVFEGSLIIHNLRPIELGALIWVLCWGGDTDCRHQIGMAKPLGFGRVMIETSSTAAYKDNSGIMYSERQLVERFVEYMGNRLSKWKIDWFESDQIQSLMNMSRATTENLSKLQYPTLGEYQAMKNNHRVLPSYAKLDHGGKRVDSVKVEPVETENFIAEPQPAPTPEPTPFDQIFENAQSDGGEQLRRRLIQLESNTLTGEEVEKLAARFRKRNDWPGDHTYGSKPKWWKEWLKFIGKKK